MKSLTKELWMNVLTRRAIVSIHDDVERLVAESGVREGFPTEEKSRSRD